MAEVEEYEDTINPFDEETAEHFVYEHRNIFADYTNRKTVLNKPDLIIVKEVTGHDNEEYVWYWVFTPHDRFIVRDAEDLGVNDVVNLVNSAIMKKQKSKQNLKELV